MVSVAKAAAVGDAAVAVSGGDESARFRALFQSEVGWVMRALRRLGVAERDVEDAAQETWVAVHRHFGTYDPTRPARPWLTTFAFHVASNHRRLARHRHEVQAPERDSDPAMGSLAAPDGSHAARDVLLRALDALTLAKRDVFVLHDVESLEPKEIASLLGVPVNTVYSRLRAAREELSAAVRKLEEVSS